MADAGVGAGGGLDEHADRGRVDGVLVRHLHQRDLVLEGVRHLQHDPAPVSTPKLHVTTSERAGKRHGVNVIEGLGLMQAQQGWTQNMKVLRAMGRGCQQMPQNGFEPCKTQTYATAARSEHARRATIHERSC